MKCVDSQNFIMKFFDKELNDIEEAQLKQHLKNCKNCSEEFNSLKEIFDIVEQDSGIEPPEDFEFQVMSRITKEEKIYKKTMDNNLFVYNILLVTVSLIFVIFFAGALWEVLKTPINLIQIMNRFVDSSKDLILSAISMFRGIVIAILSVAASIYKTYFFEYIALGFLLLITQGLFFKMVRRSNGGSQ
ncbi:zf-HC2 domain-containing protein [Ruminiclostridium herbifermentans]|uniref:Zf-HC2 domain-containing protein n=1 Tax=Ruminiclostridium herbifermentans TaxID=2488810 RepID=A0A4U7JHP3_9FIRM|nr:zf-HC2 domain-containing protein [Ruminiclostridium herbifermentans]QNU67653.1 zf-HC2 domain-containing protein [Ruminiclostridium herbifermentans]